MANATTQKAVNALYSRQDCKIGSNTEVVTYDGVTHLQLHNSSVAKLDRNGQLFITSAGYETRTTKERLNGLPGVQVCQKDWTWYLNDKVWHNSSDWIAIK